MLLHRVVGGLGVMRFECRKDLAVFVKRGLQPPFDREDQLPRAVDRKPGGLRDLWQPGIAGEGQHHLVELAIKLHEALPIPISHQRFLKFEIAAKVAELILGDKRRNMLGGSHFDGFADEGTFPDVGHRKPGDESAGLGHDIDQPVRSKPGDGIGHRAARDAKPVADLGLANDVAGAISQRQDRLFQALVDAMSQRALKPIKRQKPGCAGLVLCFGRWWV